MVDRISHIGILVHDADAASEIWRAAFGFEKFDEINVEVEGVRSIFMSMSGKPGEMAIEIMEPLDKDDMDNALARRLARQGEGFYHVCLEVGDTAASAKALADSGMTVMHRPAVKADAAGRWVVHPKDANGVMVEGIEPDSVLG
ncbi:MAG: VOC family protein [Alphaproteobacteria bacterium]|jgi:methylmalonyl-CoA/ethylmalonyl-CoA epimerase|nr:VOC family protein [Alphaproteobacteria bacterium]MDP6565918.1 VOC family protein [Alphaproteobacteria bacterium]MDP6812604.1 VOC family protein [Alphaproteobacteria bacterium]